MNFNYKFLVVAAKPEDLESLKSVLEADFEGCEIHATDCAQDAVDFCRANVYDLIVAEQRLDNMSADQMTGKIREMQNDNLTTGVLVVEREGEEGVKGFQNLGHVMIVKAPFVSENYRQSAKVLLSLKQ